MYRINLIIVILMSAFLSLEAQDRFANVEITETKLTDNIYMLEGSGGNMGLVIGEKEVLLIDDQYGPLSEKIMTKIKEISDLQVTKLVNTHWHGDHSGGNENFAEAGAMILAHQNVRERMSMEHVRGDRVTPPSPESALPVITYDESIQLHFMDEPILVMHVDNAHTDGDSFVFLPESNVLHMGDCFFHKRFPFIDASSGGTLEGMINASSTALLLVDSETKIIPGHGPIASKSDLEGYHKFLKTVKERIESYTTVGRGKENMDPNKIIEGYEEWAWGFIDAERFMDILLNTMGQGD